MCQIGLKVKMSAEHIIPVIKRFEKYWPHVDIGELLSLLVMNAKSLIREGQLADALSYCELLTSFHSKMIRLDDKETNFKAVQS